MAEGRPGFYQLIAKIYVTGRHVGSVQIVKIQGNANETLELMASQDENANCNTTAHLRRDYRPGRQQV